MEKPFELNALSLEGGTLGLCALPASAGARAAVRDFAPALLVSMITAEEMAALDVSLPGPDLAAAGIEWEHFPVPDFGVPDAGGEARWPGVSARIHAALKAGGRVVLHCRAGRGRTGMVALRLMVEAGEAPRAALARLRAARPGTVETEAQYRWACQMALQRACLEDE